MTVPERGGKQVLISEFGTECLFILKNVGNALLVEC